MPLRENGISQSIEFDKMKLASLNGNFKKPCQINPRSCFQINLNAAIKRLFPNNFLHKAIKITVLYRKSMSFVLQFYTFG